MQLDCGHQNAAARGKAQCGEIIDRRLKGLNQGLSPVSNFFLLSIYGVVFIKERNDPVFSFHLCELPPPKKSHKQVGCNTQR